MKITWRFSKENLFFKGATTVLYLIVSIGMSATSHAHHSFSGAMCKAANLNQALQLAWDQFGARNPNPIGGPSFFVVCPIPRSSQTDSNPETFEIHVQYDSLNARSVTCVLRDVDTDEIGASGNGAVVENFLVFTEGAANAGPPDVDGVDRNMPIDAGDEDNVWNYVCTLHPQTKILGYNVSD